MNLINKLYSIVRREFSGRFPKLYAVCNGRKSQIKFFFAGSTAALVNLFFLIIFHGWLNLGIVLATSLSFLLSFFVSFTLQKFWAFRNYHFKKIPVQFILYIMNAVIGLSINGYLMHILVNNIGVWYLIAQIGVSMLIGLYNFIIYSYIIFRPSKYETYGL